MAMSAHRRLALGASNLDEHSLVASTAVFESDMYSPGGNNWSSALIATTRAPTVKTHCGAFSKTEVGDVRDHHATEDLLTFRWPPT